MVHLERPTLEQGLDGGDNKLARALGSVDNPTREKGLEALARWLSRQGGASEEDVLKIWKGVFYCFWHADKARFQVQHWQIDPELIVIGCLGVQRSFKASTLQSLTSCIRLHILSVLASPCKVSTALLQR